ncbi:hypothetical protein [Bryobacter aggregatus]|uniref:hypothetical protein n=1 Tax=Bryobacter aggregatus TaxID=360054 RepID=UPI0004E25253|nr:hypothetical protein [Bryobacter aggregatus]
MRSILLALTVVGMMAAEAPEARIENGKLKAVFYLPSAETGYYRGARFDWSGAMKSLNAQGHEYFGVWFNRYDPELHDAITGPVEEFLTGEEALGWSSAKVGGQFVRIGVGSLLKPDDKPFQRFGRYKVVDPGKWSVTQKKDRIVFLQDLKDNGSGYAYRYEKTVRFEGETMWIEHKLKNTGSQSILSETYNHNFFMIDGEPSGPNLEVKFAFAAHPDRDMSAMAAKVEDSKLTYHRTLAKGESVFTELRGFGEEAKDYDFRIENHKTRAGVRVRGDQPLSKLVFWSIPTVLSPEPYIKIDVAPGKTFHWQIRYDFYTF